MQSALAVPALACALALPLAAQQVYVVDENGGPGVFFDVQNALDAGADDGDVILVRAGDYEGFSIAGQGVSVVAEAGATPHFSGSGPEAFPISGLDAGDAVVLRGLALDRALVADFPGPLVSVKEGGTVLIEDCTLTRGWPSLDVDAGAKVVLERCAVEGIAGGFAFIYTYLPGPGLIVEGEATLQGCSATGGRGYNGGFDLPPLLPVAGAAAAKVLGAGVLAALDTSFQGGGGGNGFAAFSCTPPAPGGPGLHLAAGAPVARLFGETLAGGPPGEPGEDCPPSGSSGPALLQEAGVVEDLLGPAPALAVDGIAREGQTLLGAVAGEPGALAFLAVGPAPVSLFVTPLQGTLLVAPQMVIALGGIPPSGVLPLSAPVGELGPGVLALQLMLQAAACGSGGCALGTGSFTVLLDGAL